MYKYVLIALFIAIALFLILRDKNQVLSSAEINANAPIERVWGLQTDIKNWANWNSDIESMKVNGETGLGTVFIWKVGGITIESTITEYQPNSRIAWKGKTFGVDAYHVWAFTQSGNTTHIYTEEKFTGILPWLMPGTMRNAIDKALKHGVEVLKKTAEQQSPEK